MRLFKRVFRCFAAWHWRDGPQEWNLKVTAWGRVRATIWPNDDNNFVWSTWDKDGIGGENCSEKTLQKAKRASWDALMRQEWL